MTRQSVAPAAAADGRRARREQTRRAVLQAATRLFADKGFDPTGVDEIATAAGVSKGSVFYGFTSKEGLYDAVLLDASTALIEALEGAGAGLRGRAALEAQTLTLLQLVDQHAALARLIVTELFGTLVTTTETRQQARRDVLAPLVRSLRQLREDLGVVGQSPPSEPVDETGADESLAVALIGAMVYSGLDRATNTPDRPLTEMHARLIRVLAALGPTASPAAQP